MRKPSGRTELAEEPDNQLLRRIAADTWRSMLAMVDPDTGLPADAIGADLHPDGRAGYTSPTNIGALLWSYRAALRLGLIGRTDAADGIRAVLCALATLERHQPSGMYYNSYDGHTGAALTRTPDGEPMEKFLSSVDNAWLATGLLALHRLNDELGGRADRLRASMNFGVFADPLTLKMRGGFWEQPGPDRVPGNYLGDGPVVHYTGHFYGTLNTETRMATYLGIAAGQIPPEAYYVADRGLPGGPVRSIRFYRGRRVAEGSVGYLGMRIVPSWGGSMFEALMVPQFVPEEIWGSRSWGINHPLYVRGQIEHGLHEAGYGYWGFSPSSDPAGGYREYGVPGLAAGPAGYASDQERSDRSATHWGEGVVTPHASFLALRYAPEPALHNLRNLLRDFDSYGPGGFHDAIAVRSGQVSKRHLALDQGMTMAALGNRLGADVARETVSSGPLRVLRSLMAVEEFDAAPRAGTRALATGRVI